MASERILFPPSTSFTWGRKFFLTVWADREGRRAGGVSLLLRALFVALLYKGKKEKEKSSVVFSASDGRDAGDAPGTKTLRDKKSQPGSRRTRPEIKIVPKRGKESVNRVK